jgi:hypothetical protein
LLCGGFWAWGKKSTPAPTIGQMLASLIDEVMRGKTALGIANGLTAADPVVLLVAPLFFYLTRDGLLELAQMYAAKLYDTHRYAITVKTLLDESARQTAAFENRQPSDVLAAIADCHTRIAGIQAPLSSIKKRRDEVLAHLDANSVTNITALNTTASLTIADLVRVFDETEKILRRIDTLYSHTCGELKYLGSDDYKQVLDLIADAKCAEAAEYEKMSGEPFTWPLPAKCAKPKLSDSQE